MNKQARRLAIKKLFLYQNKRKLKRALSYLKSGDPIFVGEPEVEYRWTSNGVP